MELDVSVHVIVAMTPTTNSQDVHKINKCVCEIYETIQNRSESVNQP
jgi:hypothetical protein